MALGGRIELTHKALGPPGSGDLGLHVTRSLTLWLLQSFSSVIYLLQLEEKNKSPHKDSVEAQLRHAKN